jgi:hypothetical protein
MQRLHIHEEGGQALVEFAIFGSLALLALAFLIQIGLEINYQQEIDQGAFRRALVEGKEEGDYESQNLTYIMVRERQMPDPSQPFAIMPRRRTEAASTVVWGERLAHLADEYESEPRTILDFNRTKVGADFPEWRHSDEIDEPGGQGEHKPWLAKSRTDGVSTGTSWENPTDTGLGTVSTEITTLTLNNRKVGTLRSSLTGGCDFSGFGVGANWDCWGVP